MGSEACALKGCPSSYAIELRLFLCRYRDIERNNRVRQSSATIERSDDAKAIQAKQPAQRQSRRQGPHVKKNYFV
jgi:hypothetical protein